MAGKRKARADGASSWKQNGDGDKRFITITDLDLDPDSSDDDIRNDDEASILVKSPTGKTITLKVKGSDTIGSIKVKIEAKKSIPFDQQELVFRGITLQDRDTIANLRIKKKGTLTLLRKSTSFITVYLEYLGYNITDTLKVKPSDPIRTLARSGCCYGGSLTFNDTVLEGNGTLADFDIVDGSTFVHVCRATRKMKIFVNAYTGKTFTVFVEPTNRIEDVKSIIEEDEHIPYNEQALIYNNTVLEDEGTLFDFNITRKSTLTLMHRPREFEGFIKIFIKTLTGETIALDVKPYDSIGAIKAKIEDKVGVPCDEQELVFNEMVIDDIHTLGDFHITNGSTLALMRISKGFMRIFIKSKRISMESLSKSDIVETTTLDVRPSDTIRIVKIKYHKKTCYFSPENQTLIFNGKQLEDSATLADYHIPDKSTIDFKYKPS